MAQVFLTVLHRDLQLAFRRRSDVWTTLFFFLMVCSLFPLAIGPEPSLLARLAGGVAWVAALLAGLLPLGRLFGDDLADGTLEQWLLSPHPLPLLVLGKVAAHGVVGGGLLLLAAPLFQPQILVFALVRRFVGRAYGPAARAIAATAASAAWASAAAPASCSAAMAATSSAMIARANGRQLPHFTLQPLRA